MVQNEKQEDGKRQKNDTRILEVSKMAVCCVVVRGYVLRPRCLVQRSRETRFNETALGRFVNTKMSVDAVT